MNLLIAGDSFAVRSRSVHDNIGWSQLLAQHHQTTNVAQAGISEYKIIKQLQSQDLSQYDAIVISHTSPFRVHVNHHPLHAHKPSHQHADLIFHDLQYAHSDHPVVTAGLEYFRHVFDSQYYQDLYSMFMSTVNVMTKNHPALHVCFFNNQLSTPFDNFICLHHVYDKNPGSVNHLNRRGNITTFNLINSWLQNLDC